MGHRLMTIILSNVNRFFFKFTGRFLGKFVIKLVFKMPPHLAYVATLLIYIAPINSKESLSSSIAK